MLSLFFLLNLLIIACQISLLSFKYVTKHKMEGWFDISKVSFKFGLMVYLVMPIIEEFAFRYMLKYMLVDSLSYIFTPSNNFLMIMTSMLLVFFIYKINLF